MKHRTQFKLKRLQFFIVVQSIEQARACLCACAVGQLFAEVFNHLFATFDQGTVVFNSNTLTYIFPIQRYSVREE